MEFFANTNKKVEIEVEGQVYKRHCIQTHFVAIKEDYIELLERYVKPVYEEGDILSISEKIIALCQNRVVYKEDVKPTLLAKMLAGFAQSSAAGPGVSNVYKMQFTINMCGPIKVIYAAICAGIGKVFGKRGVFYDIVGQETTGLDGFYPDVFEEYGNYGIRIPENPDGVCDEIFEKLGMVAMIADANDLNVEILGSGSKLSTYSKAQLAGMIMDNPSGQSDQLTPFILIRKAEG